MILDHAPEKIHRYNKLCVHYNLVANAVYTARNNLNNLFGNEYLPFLVAALISFDLGRMMGQGAESRYDTERGGFAERLKEKLEIIQPNLQHLTNVRLSEVILDEEQQANSVVAYRKLASGGHNGLNQTGDEFHVGATKLLHFINPGLFLIIDSNTASAFRRSHNVSYRNTTQPGYSGDKYVNCLKFSKADIAEYGVDNFRALELGMPEARIYDKLSFASGSNWF
ncbi:MAG: hypothetical protein EPN94_07490 [Nitrospirae bacterium]|nr:MAG: hypothetical protein EPN94_07490 [Nitrospirota bacterium]